MLEEKPRSRLVNVALYGLMVAGAVFVFFWACWLGGELSAPAPVQVSRQTEATARRPEVLVHVLLALAAVIALGQLLAKLFSYVRQPPVIGEVMAGILLGPSLLGSELSERLLPAEAAPFLGIIAQLGIILYMFLVGLEVNAELLQRHARAAVVISHASIVVPFLFGTALALLLYQRFATNDVPFTSFALFLGVALAITAFPVLARILSDRSMQHTDLGILALSCAAIGDVTAWCLLALAVGVAQAQIGNALVIAAGSLAFIVFMFVVVQPLLSRRFERGPETDLSRPAAGLVFLGLLLSALATEWLGIHAIFGAFLFGAVIPHDSRVARTLTRRLEGLVTVLFLPAFFALTGMRTQIGLVEGGAAWLLCGLIVLAATLGKYAGTMAAARWTGLGWRDALALGALMNTRGLMELIVLNIGLDLRIISPTLFAMMVLMALVTTLATAPVLHWAGK